MAKELPQVEPKSSTPAKCYACAKRVPIVCFFSNLTVALFKMAAGHLTGSKGLFADGIHSLSDVLATAGVIISLKISDKPADPRYPYGRGKVEFVSCVAVYAILVVIAIFILVEAIETMIAGDITKPGLVAAFCAGVSVLANLILYRLGLCAGYAVNSPAIVANATENKADMISSIAVIIGVIGARYGFLYADPLAAVLVGLIILKTGLTLGWKSIGDLLDSSLPAEKIRLLYKVVRKVEGVEGVNYIKSRRIGNVYWLDVEIEVPADYTMLEGTAISDAVRDELKQLSHKVKEAVVILAYPNPDEYEEADQSVESESVPA